MRYIHSREIEDGKYREDFVLHIPFSSVPKEFVDDVKTGYFSRIIDCEIDEQNAELVLTESSYHEDHEG